MSGDNYSYGPAFSALSVPPMSEGLYFRGPGFRTFKSGQVTAYRTGTVRSIGTGPHRAVTSAAVAASPTTPGLGGTIDVYAGK